MVKILSWDVGIKHLAGCIISNNDVSEKKPYNIYWWNIIDLLDTPPIICSCKDKKNQKCTNNAKISAIILNKQYYFCGIHKNQYTDEINKYKILPQKPIDNDFKCYKCLQVAKFYSEINNKKIGFCTQDKNKLLKEMKPKTIKQITTKDIDIDILKYNLWKLLDKIPLLINVDEVIIENQPSLKNPKMKSIAETLYNYFLCRGIIDKSKTNSPITKVKYICPNNKLRINENNTIEVLSKAKNSTETYKLTKELGIKYCNQLIKYDEIMKEHLNTFKKKDDLCDAMLQAVYYLSVKRKK